MIVRGIAKSVLQSRGELREPARSIGWPLEPAVPAVAWQAIVAEASIHAHTISQLTNDAPGLRVLLGHAHIHLLDLAIDGQARVAFQVGRDGAGTA